MVDLSLVRYIKDVPVDEKLEYAESLRMEEDRTSATTPISGNFRKMRCVFSTDYEKRQKAKREAKRKEEIKNKADFNRWRRRMNSQPEPKAKPTTSTHPKCPECGTRIETYKGKSYCYKCD